MSNEPSIHEMLEAAGYRHARDEHSHRDHRHSIWRGFDFIGRFDAGEAVKMLEREKSK